jgi:endoglucanase
MHMPIARREPRALAVLAAVLTLLALPARVLAVPAQMFEFDYADALAKSMLFYEAQRAGAHLPQYTWRVAWRQPAALTDGSDAGVDLSGGWFDAGDHVKFGLPMAYSATMLGWSLMDFPAAYEQAGTAAYARENLRFVLDYFLHAYRAGGPGVADDVFYYQVGDPGLDHAFWGPPEKMTMARPAFACTAAAPCSEVTAGTAAALAVGALVFAGSDPSYATLLRDTAGQLYAFADGYRSSAGYTMANGFYTSFSGYWDELAWGATWLYMATGDAAYLTKANAALVQAQDGTYWAQSWDNVSNGTRVLLARLTGDPAVASRVEAHLDYWLNALPRTPGGLVFLDQWGSLRYASTTAFLALVYGNQVGDAAKRDRYQSFALRQINYILGDNPRASSYVVGFGSNPPRNPHHRAAHDSPTFNIDDPVDNRHELTGALVGGPGSANDFDYVDDRRDYVRNEVADDYNAGYTGALAAIVALAGGGSVPPTSPPTVPPTPTFSPTRTPTLPPGGGVTARQTVQTDWGAGYCADVTVTNVSANPIQWQVTVPIDGALTQVWNAVVNVAGGQLTAQGLSWNSVVEPAASVAFGFCASRTGSATATITKSAATATATPAAPATATPVISATATPTRTATPTPTATAASGTASAQVVIRNDWGAGYCADVVVSTAGPAPVDWRISVPITGTLTQLWNAIYTVSGGVLTAEGLSWNNLVYPSQPVTFGFCTNR